MQMLHLPVFGFSAAQLLDEAGLIHYSWLFSSLIWISEKKNTEPGQNSLLSTGAFYFNFKILISK